MTFPFQADEKHAHLTNENKPTSAEAERERLVERPRHVDEESQPRSWLEQASRESSSQNSNPASSRIIRETTFFPIAPRTFLEAGVSESSVEELICKYLLASGVASLRAIARQVCLPVQLVETVVARLKREQILGYVGQAAMNDYVCKLTELGRERGRRFSETCSFFGATPVPLDQYIQSIRCQTIKEQNPTLIDLQRAFSDLLLDRQMMKKLGPAINSGKGMLLFGNSGNGKTSIAERVTASFGKHVWIPKSIVVDRDIIRVYDPMNHVEAPVVNREGLLQEHGMDHRWIRVERPTIVVGGELTMEHLEIQYNRATGISEAPVQMKSNCGTLVIDDFGRQRMNVEELLNRWIVPLEKRYDYLNTSSGKKIQVPFDQLVIFSTNLEPKDLVDDAFLRRIPYKIEVPNPSLENFVRLFQIVCGVLGFVWEPEMIRRMIERHYLSVGRPMRNCHPRDLLLQVKNHCRFNQLPNALSSELLEDACKNYFSII
ncbi:MAG: AAA family ATPase [Mariniblastus sp.]|nr:AAA family ATPase [Mariniblastus sp.]